MKKFQQNVSRELRRAYPDRRRLECQCLSAVAFVRAEPDLLDCPIWILVINVVAMDMLKSKLPPGRCEQPLCASRPRERNACLANPFERTMPNPLSCLQ